MNKKYYIAPLVSFEEVVEEELLAGTNIECVNGAPDGKGGCTEFESFVGSGGGDAASKSMGGYWNLEE